MKSRPTLVRGAALAASSLAVLATAALTGPAGAALRSTGPRVSVRIEGASKTLLAAKLVRTHSGSLTKAGAPKGACSAQSGAGALDVATKGRWNGKFYSSFNDYLVSSILGERPNPKSSFWEIFVNGVASQTGGCEIKLRRGDQILFAAVPAKGTVYPIAVKVPHTARAGGSFPVTVDAYSAKGKLKPLAGATVAVGSHELRTNAHGVVRVLPAHTGRLAVTASKTGFVRDRQTVVIRGQV